MTITTEKLTKLDSNIDAVEQYADSENLTFVTTSGKTKDTIDGKNKKADDAINSFKIKSKGQYLPSPVILNDGFEYVVFGDKTYFAVSPPYTTDPVTFPDPASDTVNLIDQSYLTRGQAEIIATAGDEQLAGFNIWPVNPQVSAQISDSGLVNVSLLRDTLTKTLFKTSEQVSGQITALDFTAKTATVGGVPVTLTVWSIEQQAQEQAHAGDSQVVGGSIWPISSQDSVVIGTTTENVPGGTSIIRLLVDGEILKFTLQKSLTAADIVTGIDADGGNVTFASAGVVGIKFDEPSTLLELSNTYVKNSRRFRDFELVRDSANDGGSGLFFNATTARFFDVSGRAYNIVTDKIFPANQLGVNDGIYDCLEILRYCLKQSKTFDMTGGGEYQMTYAGTDEYAIPDTDISDRWGITGDSAMPGTDFSNVLNDPSSKIILNFTNAGAQDTALIHLRQTGAHCNAIVTTRTLGRGKFLRTSIGGVASFIFGEITCIGLQQSIDLQRIVYMSGDVFVSRDCVIGPYIFNNLIGAGPWIWNTTGADGWFNNVINIRQVIIVGCTSDSGKIVASGFTVDSLDVSANGGPITFGDSNYTANGLYEIGYFYHEKNRDQGANEIVVVDGVYDFKVKRIDSADGSSGDPLPIIFFVKNSEEVEIQNPKFYGFVTDLVKTDNARVRVVGEASTGSITNFYTNTNGGSVYYEFLKPRQDFFDDVNLPIGDPPIQIGEGMKEKQCVYEFKGIAIENGVFKAFSLVIEPSVDVQVNTDLTQINFTVVTTGTEFILRAQNTSGSLSASIKTVSTRALTKYVVNRV